MALQASFGTLGVAAATFLVFGLASAEAGYSTIKRKDGSKIELRTSGNGTQVRTFDRAGKFRSKMIHPEMARQAGHQQALQKYVQPGDDVSTDWSQ